MRICSEASSKCTRIPFGVFFLAVISLEKWIVFFFVSLSMFPCMSSIHHVETPQNLVDKGSNIRFAEGAMGRLRNLCDSFVSPHAAALAALIVLVFAMVTWCVGLFPGDIVIVVTVLWMSFTECNSAVSSCPGVPWRFKQIQGTEVS